MNQIISEFITDLAIHFGRKHETKEAEQAWLKSMFHCLRGFDKETLDWVRTWFIENRTERSFPLPAEIRDKCHEYASKRAVAKKATELPVGPPPLFSDNRLKLADDLVMRASMSKQAAREGWILELYWHCVNNGMLPVGAEIDAIKRAAKRFDNETYPLAVRNAAEAIAPEPRVKGFVTLGSPDVWAAWVRLSDSMIARREELRRRILGDAA